MSFRAVSFLRMRHGTGVIRLSVSVYVQSMFHLLLVLNRGHILRIVVGMVSDVDAVDSERKYCVPSDRYGACVLAT